MQPLKNTNKIMFETPYGLHLYELNNDFYIGSIYKDVYNSCCSFFINKEKFSLYLEEYPHFKNLDELFKYTENCIENLKDKIKREFSHTISFKFK